MDVPTAYILAQPRPWEPVSFHWQAGKYASAEIEWTDWTCRHIMQNTVVGVVAHLKLANGQTVIVKPKSNVVVLRHARARRLDPRGAA